MILIKRGEGKSKAYADLAKISFTLMTTNVNDKTKLLEDYLVDYKKFKSDITSFLNDNDLDVSLVFEHYYAGEQTKNVKTEDNNETTYTQVHDYFYIVGSFSLELPIVDNDRSNIARLISLISDLNKEISISYSVDFTLSEELRAELNGEATNNALDNLKIEVRNIANHLNMTSIGLIEINFENSNNGYVYDSVNREISSSAVMSKEEQIEVLEDMLESKEIEVTSKFTSKWEVV